MHLDRLLLACQERACPELTCLIPRETGSIILKIAYGYTTEPFENDTLVDMAGDAMDKFARAAVPGSFMVDMMPFCA